MQSERRRVVHAARRSLRRVRCSPQPALRGGPHAKVCDERPNGGACWGAECGTTRARRPREQNNGCRVLQKSVSLSKSAGAQTGNDAHQGRGCPRGSTGRDASSKMPASVPTLGPVWSGAWSEGQGWRSGHRQGPRVYGPADSARSMVLPRLQRSPSLERLAARTSSRHWGV